MLLRPRDKRFRDIKIVNQTDQSLEAPKEKGITRFFIKKHAGWTNERKGAARFFGLEGFDFTLKTKEKEEAVIGLYDAVKIVLGEQLMRIITPEIKQRLEEAKFGVTTEPVTTEGVDRPNAGNENQFSESDKALIKAKGEAAAKAGRAGEKADWIKVIGLIALGAFASYLATHMGWIK